MNKKIVFAAIAAVLLALGLVGYGFYQSWAAEGFKGCRIEIATAQPKVKVGEPLELTARVTNRAGHPRVLTLHDAVQRSLVIGMRENGRPVPFDVTLVSKRTPDALKREWLWPDDQLEVKLKLAFSLDKLGRCRADYYGTKSGPVTHLDKLQVHVIGLPYSATSAKAEKVLSNPVAVEVTR